MADTEHYSLLAVLKIPFKWENQYQDSQHNASSNISKNNQLHKMQRNDALPSWSNERARPHAWTQMRQQPIQQLPTSIIDCIQSNSQLSQHWIPMERAISWYQKWKCWWIRPSSFIQIIQHGNMNFNIAASLMSSMIPKPKAAYALSQSVNEQF